MIAVMLIISSMSFSQDTLDVYDVTKGDVTIHIHLEEGQSIVQPEDEIYLYLHGAGKFYITVDNDGPIYGSNTSLILEDGYTVAQLYYSTEIVRIAFGGETFKFNIR